MHIDVILTTAKAVYLLRVETQKLLELQGRKKKEIHEMDVLKNNGKEKIVILCLIES